MSTNAAIGLVISVAFAGGLILLVMGWRGQKVQLGSGEQITVGSAERRRICTALVATLMVGLITRWPVAALAAAGAVWLWPKLFGAGRAGEQDLGRIEALATWTESLRDTIAGAMSLEQAIPVTMAAAPRQLREPLAQLVGMLRARIPLGEALSRFGDELNDASADLVVAALILNARLRGPGLEATLSELAVHAREELELRQRHEAERVTLRRSARIIVGVTLAFSTGLAVFAREYVEPYSTPVGQLMLAVVIGVYVAGFMWLRRLADYQVPARFLISADQLADVQLAGATR